MATQRVPYGRGGDGNNAETQAERNEDSRMISDRGVNEVDSPQKKAINFDDKDRVNSGVSTTLP